MIEILKLKLSAAVLLIIFFSLLHFFGIVISAFFDEHKLSGTF